MNYSTLKRTRVLLALLFFFAIFTSFTDIYELLPEKTISNIIFLQFIPSLLKFIQITSLAGIGYIIIIALTVLFGRIYCSTICPLGILQDIFSFVAKKRSKNKIFYKYKKPHFIIRYTLLSLTVISLIAGISLAINLLDPYSNTGRIFTYSVKPVLVWLNNFISGFLQNQKIYTLHIIELGKTPLAITLYTLTFFLFIAYLSYKRGRLFCNTICPVGTLLGFLSKQSIFKIKIDNQSCSKCGKCSSVCKSECIDLKHQKIDYSRCVSCFNCLPVCEDNAIDFHFIKKQTSSINPSESEKKVDRRSAISTMLALTASSTILAQGKNQHRQGRHKEYKLTIRENAISPPGSKNIDRFNSLCTACGLCISACPTNVLQPSLMEYGLIGFMQPHMDYAHTGFCNFDCNRCGEICPTGAILPLPLPQKQLTQLGKAVFIKRNCVVHRDGTDCGACSEHCPTKAVDMVPYRDGLVIPQVNQEICIGCGACEHPCPVEYPHKAIFVESNIVHALAEKPKEEESQHKPIEDDFPF
ncbi:4Fe-4S dicluster domain-containing protein [Labilibacter sediminis]|nr:4Fe-4S dicluster domain-containing protein [Labilibacter sediminis]